MHFSLHVSNVPFYFNNTKLACCAGLVIYKLTIFYKGILSPNMCTNIPSSIPWNNQWIFHMLHTLLLMIHGLLFLLYFSEYYRSHSKISYACTRTTLNDTLLTNISYQHIRLCKIRIIQANIIGWHPSQHWFD